MIWRTIRFVTDSTELKTWSFAIQKLTLLFLVNIVWIFEYSSTNFWILLSLLLELSESYIYPNIFSYFSVEGRKTDPLFIPSRRENNNEPVSSHTTNLKQATKIIRAKFWKNDTMICNLISISFGMRAAKFLTAACLRGFLSLGKTVPKSNMEHSKISFNSFWFETYNLKLYDL